MGRRAKKRKSGKNKRNPPHHIMPSSRDGADDEFNKIYPPLDLHVQYHILFENWTPKEIIERLRAYWRGDDEKILKHFNKPNKKKAYKIILDNKKFSEAEEYLENVWFDPVVSPYGFFRKGL